MEIVTEDFNLITGDKITTTALMSSDDEGKVVKTKEPKKPLVKMRDAGELLNW